jgi:hypothetical protein
MEEVMNIMEEAEIWFGISDASDKSFDMFGLARNSGPICTKNRITCHGRRINHLQSGLQCSQRDTGIRFGLHLDAMTSSTIIGRHVDSATTCGWTPRFSRGPRLVIHVLRARSYGLPFVFVRDEEFGFLYRNAPILPDWRDVNARGRRPAGVSTPGGC